MIAAIVTNPLDVIKTRRQVQIGDANSKVRYNEDV
jgi:hypothetical protein